MAVEVKGGQLMNIFLLGKSSSRWLRKTLFLLQYSGQLLVIFLARGLARTIQASKRERAAVSLTDIQTKQWFLIMRSLASSQVGESISSLSDPKT